MLCNAYQMRTQHVVTASGSSHTEADLPFPCLLVAMCFIELGYQLDTYVLLPYQNLFLIHPNFEIRWALD